MSSKRETDPMMIHEYRKVVAQQIAAELYDNAVGNGLSWEEHPELGEFDWDEVAEMVRGKGPAYPQRYELQQAWKGLTGNE